MAAEFVDYHKANLAVLNELRAAIRAGKADLADARSRTKDSMLG